MFKADQFVEFICDKRQQGEEILVMGDFNAHFDIGGKALDCRAKFLNRLNKVGGLRNMNFADFTRGKWTWQGREKQSVLDYILMSQELADSTSSMTIVGLKQIVRIFANIRISLNQTNIFRGSNCRRQRLFHFSAICTEAVHRRTLPRFRYWSATRDRRKSLPLHRFSSHGVFIMVCPGFVLC